MRSFLRKLQKIGFQVVSKPIKLIVDETGRKLEKANFDVEITADVLGRISNLVVVVLFSGDSDFAYLARFRRKKGKKLYVYSSKKTLSWELKLTADKCFF